MENQGGVVVKVDSGSQEAARLLAEQVGEFSRHGLAQPPRCYQLAVAQAIARSIVDGRGLTFTVLFPRQAGKNELSAQLEAWLLFPYEWTGGAIVKAAPTFKPQLINSMMRLERMRGGRLTRHWRKVQGTSSSWRGRRARSSRLGRASIVGAGAGSVG